MIAQRTGHRSLGLVLALGCRDRAWFVVADDVHCPTGTLASSGNATGTIRVPVGKVDSRADFAQVTSGTADPNGASASASAATAVVRR